MKPVMHTLNLRCSLIIFVQNFRRKHICPNTRVLVLLIIWDNFRLQGMSTAHDDLLTHLHLNEGSLRVIHGDDFPCLL